MTGDEKHRACPDIRADPAGTIRKRKWQKGVTKVGNLAENVKFPIFCAFQRVSPDILMRR